jgi:hypothetical protein
MKHIYIILLIFGLTNLSAQQENEFKTIFGGHEVGGYGSFSIGYSMIDTTNALTFSARGGAIIGHTLALGIGGSGFVTEYADNLQLAKKGSLGGGYGGVFSELILLGKSPVHLSIPVLAGFGGVAYTTWENEGTDYSRVNYTEDMTTFLVLEPGVELEFNISKFFRLAGYFNYRYTSDIDLTTTNNEGRRTALVKPDALNTYSAGLIFKFGKF